MNHKIGNLFNPVIFAFITGFCRAQLYDFVRKHDIERETVFFAVDSTCTTKKLDVNSIKLGDFSFDNEAKDVFVLQNGFYSKDEKWIRYNLVVLRCSGSWLIEIRIHIQFHLCHRQICEGQAAKR